MTKAQELRDQSDQQLTERVRDIEKELFKLRNELALMHKIEKPHLIQAKRKEIAQILTILTERKKGIVVQEKKVSAVEAKEGRDEKKERKAKEKAEKKAEKEAEKRAEQVEAEEEKAEKKEKVRKKREKKE